MFGTKLGLKPFALPFDLGTNGPWMDSCVTARAPVDGGAGNSISNEKRPHAYI